MFPAQYFLAGGLCPHIVGAPQLPFDAMLAATHAEDSDP